jgi:N-acetylmuramic acid 6-phosphate etherase
MNFTEANSLYDSLEKMSVFEILQNINQEDKKVAFAVEKAIPQISLFVEHLRERMEIGGRLFYIGAGTSGRLGVVDASECPPTFGVPHDRVIGLIAGGQQAVFKAVEFAEDNAEQAWQDLLAYEVNKTDTVVGIAASGRTPFVTGGVKKARENGLLTACIVCNPDSILAKEAEYPIEVITGPEFVTGSTRMKAGTAQKLVLNMITTSVMIQLGRVRGHKMVDMQLSNHKLIERGVRFIVAETGENPDTARQLLLNFGSVRKVIEHLKAGK